MSNIWRDSGNLVRNSEGDVYRGVDCPCDCVIPCSCPCSGTYPPASWPCGGLLETYSVTAWTYTEGFFGSPTFEWRIPPALMPMTVTATGHCQWESSTAFIMEKRTLPDGEWAESGNSRKMNVSFNNPQSGGYWYLEHGTNINLDMLKSVGCDPTGTEYSPRNPDTADSGSATIA